MDTAAALAAVLSAAAWSVRPVAAPVVVSTPNMPQHNVNRPFALLFGSYTLEGIGDIIAGTFLVAAVAPQDRPGGPGNGAWLVVGWQRLRPRPCGAGALSSRYSHPVLLTAALLLQAAGIARACTASGAAALLGAIPFGGTIIGVSTLTLAAGRLLQFPSALTLPTDGCSAGQIIGPVAVSPLLRHGWSCR